MDIKFEIFVYAHVLIVRHTSSPVSKFKGPAVYQLGKLMIRILRGTLNLKLGKMSKTLTNVFPQNYPLNKVVH